jgi:hypothetical protein
MKKIIVLFMLFFAIVCPSVLYAAEGETTEYVLPYPGLLPDHPLYTFKVARDGLVGLLITDSAKKASFDILQADKRLAEAKALIEKDKKKYPLAETTLSKGENYMEEAITKTKEAKKEGIATSDLEVTLFKSVRKHKKIIAELHVNAPKDQKNSFASLLKRVTQYEKTVSSFISLDQAK